MAQSIAPLIKFLGFNSQGDLGPYTVYTSRQKRLVFFARAPPLTPASIEQRGMRNRFRVAAQMWQALTPDQRAKWKRLAQESNQRITGYNLWTYTQTTGDRTTIQTLITRTGIDPWT